MADIKVYNVDALGKPLGQYSHVTRVKAAEYLYIAGMLAQGVDFDAQCTGVFATSCTRRTSPKFMAWRLREFPKLFPNGVYPPNTLLIIDRLVQKQFLIEVQTVAAL